MAEGTPEIVHISVAAQGVILAPDIIKIGPVLY
jgi:hypothetical protein